MIWMSNLRLGSTRLEALCILKLNCHPLSINSSAVLLLLGFRARDIILLGSCAMGIFLLGFIFLDALLSVPLRLKLMMLVCLWASKPMSL